MYTNVHVHSNIIIHVSHVQVNINTVKPLNKGHVGASLCREVVHSSEVQIYY